MKKLIIGWFTFTCSEDSTMLMIEALNQHWQNWTKLIDFKYAKALRTINPLGPMDIAFVEGAISSSKQEEKLKHIRSLAKTLVAIGSCAVTGQPAGQRNNFDPQQLQEIKPVLEKFNFSPQARKLTDIIKIDYSIPGCPMDEQKFIDLTNKLINENKIKPAMDAEGRGTPKKGPLVGFLGGKPKAEFVAGDIHA